MEMRTVKLGDIATIYNGNSINKTEKKQKYMNDVPGWNYIGTKDVNYDGSIEYNTGVIIPYSEDGFRLAPSGSVFVCSEGGNAGKKTAIVKEEVCFGNKLFAIVNDRNLFNEKYIFFYTRYKRFQEQFKLLATSLMGGISARNFATIEIPFPEIKEQERIVAKIEELFSHLDAGVEMLKKTKAQLAVYRQAVLKESFEDSSIEKIKVSQICNVVRGGSPRPAGDERYYNGSIPFLKVADITRKNGMYLYDYTYTIKEAGLQKTRMVPANTLLLSNSGATLGIPKICTFETTMNDGIAAFLNLDLDREFLPYHYYFWLSKTIELRAIDQGAAQPNLNTNIIGAYDFPHCSYDEQRHIAQEIESRLSVCDSIEQTVDAAIQQAGAMRQSILKDAFEGRL